MQNKCDAFHDVLYMDHKYNLLRKLQNCCSTRLHSSLRLIFLLFVALQANYL